MMDDEPKVEGYAESMEHQWVQNYVVPHLQRTYSVQVKALEDWILRHGGVSIPLSDLAGDPTTTEKNGMLNVMRAWFDVSSAVRQLAADVAKGFKPPQTHIEFARELHYAECYDEALQILGRVLSGNPDELNALTLKADIYEHQDRYAEARELAEYVVERDDESEDAWWVLMNVYEAMSEWRLLLGATERRLRSGRGGVMGRAHALLTQARAQMQLDRCEDAKASLAAVAAIEWHGGKAPSHILRRISEIESGMQSRLGA